MAYSIDATSKDCYEGTTVLINKLGIRDEEQLKRNEALLYGIKSSELMIQPLKSDLFMIGTIQAAAGVIDNLIEFFNTAIV